MLTKTNRNLNMKYFLYLLFLIQFQNCKSETNIESKDSSNNDVKVEKLTQENYSIDSIDKSAIGEKIKKLNKIKELKSILKNSLERQIERPYMFDIFVSSNDTLLQFYDYKFFEINGTKIKSYFIKIDYEDADFQCILLVNENLNVEYNSMIVYEELNSEVKYLRITEIKADKLYISFKSPNPVENLFFQVKDGMFLDYFDNQIVDEKWGEKEIFGLKEIFKYLLKGKTNNHLKNGYWVEKRYSFQYDKSVIQDGNYANGLRTGNWNYSPEGPVDVIKKFDDGRFVSQSYP
jgi:hypothetical protein